MPINDPYKYLDISVFWDFDQRLFSVRVTDSINGNRGYAFRRLSDAIESAAVNLHQRKNNGYDAVSIELPLKHGLEVTKWGHVGGCNAESILNITSQVLDQMAVLTGKTS